MKIALFGHGKTTQAIAQRYKNCLIFDDRFTTENRDSDGNILLPPAHFATCSSDIQIPSPGFPPNHTLVQNATNLISEYDFFAREMPFTIWISGTNGKTTTTQMITHLLAQNGARSGGNIGTPLAALEQSPIWVLESSSFTLHYTKSAYPGLYVLLPIRPDHISWHGSFEAYEDTKLSVLARMREGSVVILPEIYQGYPSKAMKITYKDAHDLAEKMGITISHVGFQRPFAMDAVMALCVQKILFDRIDYTLMNTFKTDAHKLEEFCDGSGRTWVNDTKGTNVDATIEALKRYANKEIFIILGGDDKGAPLDALFTQMQPLQVSIFAIGSNMQKIVDNANKIGKKVHACGTLANAVELIKPQHTKETIALLSPAAASLDQFSSYIERGELFKCLALAK